MLWAMNASEQGQEGGLAGMFGGLFEGLLSLFGVENPRERTLEATLTQDHAQEEGFIQSSVNDMVRAKMAESLKISEEELVALLGEGKDVNAILQAAGIDTASLTLGQLENMTPEEVREKLFTKEVIKGLMEHERLGPLMLKTVAYNEQMANQLYAGTDQLEAHQIADHIQLVMGLNDKAVTALATGLQELDLSRAPEKHRASFAQMQQILTPGNTALLKEVLSDLPQDKVTQLIELITAGEASQKELVELVMKDPALYDAAKRLVTELDQSQMGSEMRTKLSQAAGLIEAKETGDTLLKKAGAVLESVQEIEMPSLSGVLNFLTGSEARTPAQ